MAKTIAIPENVLITAHSLDELEDWLAANEPKFLAQMRSIQADEDLAGEGKDLEELLKRWPIES